jgi:hypothetical protein
LFNATANNPDNAGILVGSLDGSTPMRLPPDDSNGIYVPGAGAAGGGGEGGHLFSSARAHSWLSRSMPLG